MKTIIAGAGEIGRALAEFLHAYEPQLYDPDKGFYTYNTCDVLHISFPYSDTFVQSVISYQEQFKPIHTVIHSTVPVGTSRELNAIHSPVIGLHPFIIDGLSTFTKFLGGPVTSELADYFRRAGFKIYLCDKQETTELAKLSQTTLYALQIEYVKNLKSLCDHYQVPFSEVHTLFSHNYNEGYARNGFPEFHLPLLVPIPGAQRGHCTIPNCSLWDTPFTDLIKKLSV